MTLNGEIATSKATIYQVPSATPAIPGSGSPQMLAWVRVVNASGSARTFNLYLNLNGTSRNFIPVNTQLPTGAAYGDDIPPIAIPVGALVEGDADAAGVYWTISVE
jgi:hypothetical protein